MGKQSTVPAGEFKARCLALLDEVAETGREIVVTKRGRAVARVVPVEKAAPLRGSVLQADDIVEPPDVEWEATR
ncbi:MAG TPA: type II toxin-antitoxin system Phd/YefM family antitoxin [Thermoanaerobaculia bacterium]|nr:type II toxin-antitoxin system Phd/YefM family antitoxin [Thermoanaerobaculia bacterium]